MYRIFDKQNICYKNDNLYKTKKAVRENLISYHSIDVDYNWLKTMSLEQLCAEFDWEIEQE